MGDTYNDEAYQLLQALRGNETYSPAAVEIAKLLKDIIGSGGLSIPDDQIFDSTTARDAFFAVHPERLDPSGPDYKPYCLVSGQLQVYIQETGEWTDGTAAIKGNKGDPGKSAYQVWLDEGNTGTEQDYLDSLKGDLSSIGTFLGVVDYSYQNKAWEPTVEDGATSGNTSVSIR
jgi:hypothetical protein